MIMFSFTIERPLQDSKRKLNSAIALFFFFPFPDNKVLCTVLTGFVSWGVGQGFGNTVGELL